MKKLSFILLLSISCFLICSCRGEDEVLVRSTGTQVQAPMDIKSITGFYLLNEGNMGSNKCTLDYMDYATGYYHKNIYAETNPSVVLELGDVGNDIQIYGEKLYAVINCSHFIEVMNKKDARHLGTIDIPNCRYITFHEGYAYVSSYAGPVQIDPNARLGYVAKVDTTTLQVVATCLVGYQPEEMVIKDGKLYVANSGGYRFPDYDRTVSVIDLKTFQVIKTIDVAINLHHMKLDRYGRIYVSSRGDYYGTGSNVFVIDTQTDCVTGSLGIAASEMCLSGDSIYMTSVEWSYVTESNTITYALYDVKQNKMVSRNFITDGTEAEIAIPYGVTVNPETKEIFVTDAKSYVVPGYLYCFSPEGKKRWKVRAGDIPAHFAFTTKTFQ